MHLFLITIWNVGEARNFFKMLILKLLNRLIAAATLSYQFIQKFMFYYYIVNYISSAVKQKVNKIDFLPIIALPYALF